jgi:hypothetical protein
VAYVCRARVANGVISAVYGGKARRGLYNNKDKAECFVGIPTPVSTPGAAEVRFVDAGFELLVYVQPAGRGAVKKSPPKKTTNKSKFTKISPKKRTISPSKKQTEPSKKRLQSAGFLAGLPTGSGKKQSSP